MAEKRTIELEVKDNSKSLKAQLREAQAEVAALADKYGATSQQAVNAAKRAAELKDRIGDAKALTDAFNPDAKFKALSASLTGVAGGFSAVQGAMGLVGAEGEDIQKAMLKVQSAMALSQGLQSLGEARDSFKQLGATIKDAAIKLGILTVVQEEQTAAVGSSVLATEAQTVANAEAAVGFKATGVAGKTAFNGIKGAIAATGIGLLVVALGTIVAYWDDIKAAVGGVTSELQNNIDLSKMQVDSAQKQVDLFGLQENSLRLQGKTEKEILQLRMIRLKNLAKEQEEDIKLAENKKKLEVAAAERNNKLLKAYVTMQLEGMLLPFRAIALMVDGTILTINQGLKALGKSELQIKTVNEYLSDFREYAAEGLAGMIFDPKEVAAESDKEIAELKKALAKTKSEIDGAQLQINQITLDNAKSAAAQQDEINKAADAKIKEYNDKLQAYYDAVEAKRQADITDARQKELQATANKYEALYDLADKAGKDTSDLQKQQGAEEVAINKKYDDLEIQAKKDKAKKLQEMMKEMDDAATKQFITAEEIKIAAMQDGLDKEAAIRKLAYDKEQIELQNKLDAGLITMEQFQAASRANNKAYQDGITADNQAAYKKQVDDEMAAYEQKAALQNQYADIASQAANLIKELFGKSKAAQKTAVIVESAAGIAKMVISNKLANLGALATPQAIASSGVSAAPVIAANNVQLGLGIAANVAATAKALKEIGGGGSAPSAPSASGGGGGASGGGAGGGVMAPNFNVVGNNGLNQLAQLQQQPIKAYVVGAEVTTQQALDRNRITNATL